MMVRFQALFSIATCATTTRVCAVIPVLTARQTPSRRLSTGSRGDSLGRNNPNDVPTMAERAGTLTMSGALPMNLANRVMSTMGLGGAGCRARAGSGSPRVITVDPALAFNACLQRLKLTYEKLLSNFAFNLNLRHYPWACWASRCPVGRGCQKMGVGSGSLVAGGAVQFDPSLTPV